jgi:hypothetical protein
MKNFNYFIEWETGPVVRGVGQKMWMLVLVPNTGNLNHIKCFGTGTTVHHFLGVKNIRYRYRYCSYIINFEL